MNWSAGWNTPGGRQMVFLCIRKCAGVSGWRSFGLSELAVRACHLVLAQLLSKAFGGTARWPIGPQGLLSGQSNSQSTINQCSTFEKKWLKTKVIEQFKWVYILIWETILKILSWTVFTLSLPWAFAYLKRLSGYTHPMSFRDSIFNVTINSLLF